MKPRCDDLKTKTLDQTNAELMMEIKSSNNEIREMKESIENLKLSKDKITKKYELLEVELQDKMKMYTVIQKQCEELQKQCEHMTKDTEQLKTSQKDTVPWNIRGKMQRVHDLKIVCNWQNFTELWVPGAIQLRTLF